MNIECVRLEDNIVAQPQLIGNVHEFPSLKMLCSAHLECFSGFFPEQDPAMGKGRVIVSFL
jgi:hypothetical protein